MREMNQSLNRSLARRELVEKIGKLAGALTTEEIGRRKIMQLKSKRRKRAELKHYAGNATLD